MNLFSGFTAIVYFSQNEFFKGAIFILVAAVFDMLDGVMARLVKATSEFGVELDSLCDAVSFGVAPSFMLYKIYFFQLQDFGILLASLPALAGVMRLARFNVKLTSFEDKKYFTGLPIPSAALFIVSFIIFFYNYAGINKDLQPYLITSVTVLAALAMVSHIRYDNIPRPDKRTIKQHPFLFIIFLIGVIGSIFTKGLFIFPFMVFYIFSGALRHFFRWLKEKREAVDDIDESEEEEPGPYII